MKIVGFYLATILVHGEVIEALDNNVILVTENIQDVNGFQLFEKQLSMQEFHSPDIELLDDLSTSDNMWVIGGAGQSCAESCQDLGRTCESNYPTTTKSQLKDRLEQAGKYNPKITSGNWKTASGLNPAYTRGESNEWVLGKVAPNCEDKVLQRSGLCYCTQHWVIGGAGQSCADSCQDLGRTCESKHPTTTKSQLKDRLEQAGELNPKITSGDWKTASGLNPAYTKGESNEWVLGKVAPNCEDKVLQRSGLCYCTQSEDDSSLDQCEDVEKAVIDLYNALKDIDHVSDVGEVFNKGQALLDTLNPSKWAPEYQNDFLNFFDPKQEYLYSVEGLEFLCDRFIRRHLAGNFDKIIRCLAKWSNGTIVLAASGSLTVAGKSQSMGFNVAYGEDGQTSCSYIEEGSLLSYKHGFDSSLYGAEMSYAVSWMPSVWGGFGNIGSNHHGEGQVWTVTISFGNLVDIDLFAVFDLSNIAKIETIVKKVQEILNRDYKEEFRKLSKDGPKEFTLALCSWLQSILVTALELLGMVTGIAGFGAGFSAGLEIIDLSDTLLIEIPTISALHGSELLITCNGKECQDKKDYFKTVKGLDDSKPCTMPFGCLYCKNKAYPWYGTSYSLNPLQLYCGKQPCWKDHTPCNTLTVNPCDPKKALNFGRLVYHHPGKTCCNEESFWYGRDYLPITAPTGTGNRCGKQACFKDGTLVGGLTMPYKVCCNTAETWYGSKATVIPGMKRCGKQPCFRDEILVGGPTMPYKVCCNKAETWYGSKATAPFTKRCGRQSCFSDGTVVGGLLMPYSVCCNTAKTWYGSKYTPPGIKRCGNQSCFGRGTICGGPTMPCSTCCKFNRAWYQINIDCD